MFDKIKSMKMSKMGVAPEKQAPKDAEAINHKLLVQGAFVKQEMAGVFTYLPLGLKVINKIENIVRKHMDKIGAEILMPTLSPKENWERTGRIDKVDVLMKTTPANEASREKNDSEYIISPTHEEMVTPLCARFNNSYKDFPVAFYQIQTKFRNEPRAKNGLLRGREFRMKDLYSFHTSEEDLKRYYEESKQVYLDIYNELGIGEDTYIALASGGDFTKDYSHEFQIRLETGEDVLYRDLVTGVVYNKEVAPVDADNPEKFEKFRASEIGNIFPLGTKFTKANNYEFTDADGERKPIYMGSYGIGISRIMGVMVEKFNDDKGIIWPKNIAPFRVSLVNFEDTKDQAEEIYNKLIESGIEVLWDDREVSAGSKFADADLIGCPFRLVISKRSLENGGVELKGRTDSEGKVVSLTEAIEEINK